MNRGEGQQAKHGFVEKCDYHIRHLTNGGRGKLDSMSDALVAMLEVQKWQLSVDYMTHEDYAAYHSAQKPRFGWPLAATIITIVISLLGIAMRVI